MSDKLEWLKKQIPKETRSKKPKKETKPKRKAYPISKEWFAPYLPKPPTLEEQLIEKQLQSFNLDEKEQRLELKEEEFQQLKTELQEEFEDKIVVRIDNEKIRENQIQQIKELNRKIREKQKQLEEKK